MKSYTTDLLLALLMCFIMVAVVAGFVSLGMWIFYSSQNPLFTKQILVILLLFLLFPVEVGIMLISFKVGNKFFKDQYEYDSLYEESCEFEDEIFNIEVIIIDEE